MKAHVEHAVGLVDHQHLDGSQAGGALVAEVDQPPGRRDENVDRAVAQEVALFLVVDAADQADDPGIRIGREFPGVRLDLHRQFPRRGEHQGPRRAGRKRTLEGELQLPGQDGDEEGRGLAGTGLSLARDVVVGKTVGQDFALDWRAGLEPEIVDRIHDRPG